MAIFNTRDSGAALAPMPGRQSWTHSCSPVKDASVMLAKELADTWSWRCSAHQPDIMDGEMILAEVSGRSSQLQFFYSNGFSLAGDASSQSISSCISVYCIRLDASEGVCSWPPPVALPWNHRQGGIQLPYANPPCPSVLSLTLTWVVINTNEP